MVSIRRGLCSLLVLAATLLAPHAHAQTFDHRVYLDLDNNPATGCSVPTAAGTINGAEVRVSGTISGQPPVVASSRRELCSNGSFVAGTTQAAGYAVGLENGSNGGDVVELSTGLDGFGRGGTARLIFASTSAAGADLVEGSVFLPIATPLVIPAVGIVGLVLLGVVLLFAARRHPGFGSSAALLLLVGAGVAWAANFIADGQTGDWTGVPPVAVDAGNDASSGEPQIELTSVYAATEGSTLFLRLDVADANPSGPVFTSASSATFRTGMAGSVTIAASGSTSLALTSGTLPGGLGFDPASGVLSGTPVAGSGGLYTLVFTASGPSGTATQTFVLTINQAPAITSVAATTFALGAAGSFTVTTSGFPAPGLTRGGVALPGGVSFVDNGDGTGTLSGTPAPGTAGSYALSFTASNVAGSSAAQAFTLDINAAPQITSAASTSLAIGAAGSFTISASGTPTPAISVTGALPSGVSVVDNGNGTATLGGTPAAGTGGSYPLTVTASNGVLPNATQSFTLSVNQAPSITSASSAAFSIGATNSFTVTTSGFPAPALTLGGAVLPSGVGFVDNGNGTGTLSGIPAAGSGGSYALTVSASNASGTVMQSLTLTVSGSPGFTSATATSFAVGSAGSFTVTATGSPTPALALTGTLPSGLSFVDNGNGTGTLSGTPAAGSGGNYPLGFTASNGVLPNATQSFTLSVSEAPSITSASSAAFSIGASNSFTVTSSGFPAPALTLGGAALPSGVGFVDNGNGTGTLSGIPAAGSGGSYALTVSASNASGTVMQSLTLTVSGSPGFTSATATSFAVGSAGSFTVTATGSPTPALALTGALPSGLSFVDNGNGTGTLSGTPAAGSGGNYPLGFTASNGVLPNATQSFTLSVNQAPTVTSAATTTFTTGNVGSFTVTTSGFPAPALTRGGVALPGGVSFVDNGDGTGTLSGTPAPGTVGSYALSFTASNVAGSSAAQAFTLDINAAPQITSAASTSLAIGAAGSFTISASGAPTPAISVTGTLPSGVSVVDNGNGTATLGGTPAAGTGGSYPLTVSASNGVLPNATQSLTLSINQPPSITSASSDTFVVGVADSFTVSTSGFPTPSLALSGTLPTGVSFTAGSGVLGGTATQTGTFALQLEASNGVAPDAQQNFSLSVVCPAITVSPAPAALAEGLFGVSYAGASFSQTGSTGSSLTWSATGLPAGLAINASTGVIGGTPSNTVLDAAVVITATDNFGCQGSRSTTITVRPAADNESYTGGVGNTQFVVGATAPGTPHVLVSDNVKTGDAGPGALSVTFPASTTNGSLTEGSTDGTFIYTPDLGFAGPSDSFTYTLTDGNGITNTATVTISLSNLVWYVNSTAGAGDGRSHSPFNTLAAAQTPSGANSTIYVHSGGATTTGDLGMDSGQTLHGAGALFTLNGLSIAAGTRPTLTGTVTLANATTVRAVNFTPTGIPALQASGTTGAIAIDQVAVTGGTNSLSLSNTSGAVDVSNASFTNASGAEVLINQGSGNVTIGATLSSNAGRSVDISNRSGGTVSFTGAISDTGTGIRLNANTGATIRFSGGLSLSTGANEAFAATAGGTVEVCDENPCNPAATGALVNTLTTTTATALNVNATQIGSNRLEFRSISSNGGSATGIILDNTGASGGLSVKGSGSAASGGTIANKTGANGATSSGIGIYLNSTASVSLDRMQLNDFQNYAIRGFNVNGFALANSVVNATGAAKNGDDDATDEGSISFGAENPSGTNGLTGVVSITNSIIEDGYENNFKIANLSGTLSQFTMTGSTVRDNSSASPGNNGLEFRAQGSANITADITTSTFTGNRSNGIQVSTTSDHTGTVDVNVGSAGVANSGGTFSGNNIGVNIAHGSPGTLRFAVHRGTFNSNPGLASPININLAAGGGAGVGAMSGFITGNTISNANSATGPGIRVTGNGTDADGSNVLTLEISNNTITQIGNRGIEVIARDGNNRINATIVGNNVTLTDALSADAIRVDAGATATDTTTICADIRGNTASSVVGVFGIRVRQRFAGTSYLLEDYAGSATDDTAVENYLAANNGSATSSADHAGAGFISIADCPTP